MSILILPGFIGMITGLMWLVYYGFKGVWWAPFALLGIGLAFQFVSNMIEYLIGSFELSMLGFIGWPVCAFLMFISVLDLATRSHEKDILGQFVAAMESANLTSCVVNKGVRFSVMSEMNADELMRHYRAALSHAEKVDAEFLNRKHNGWGIHFESEFLTGLHLVVEGNDKADVAKSLAGQKLMASWEIWLNENVKKIWEVK